MNYANKEKPTFTPSNFNMTFIQSCSAGSTFKISSLEPVNRDIPITGSTSPDLNTLIFKTKTYLAVTGSNVVNNVFNGAFTADSSSVLFLTGSGTKLGAGSQSQAENLLAAITSSNGHGDSFDINININNPAASIAALFKKQIPLISKVRGPIGNTLSASIGHQTGSGPGGLEDAISTEPINNTIPFTGGKVAIPDFDDGHIETRYTFRMIGDTEYYSGSFSNSANFSNASYFYNPFKDQMYKGAQNNTPGFSPSEKYEDYSSASFYRVKVTGGENQIIVKGDGTSTLDSDDNIIY